MKIGGFNWVNQPAIGPSNEHSVNVAQTTLNNTVSRANKQLMNALEVDGFKVFLYRRVLGGCVCPCARQFQAKRSIESVRNNEVGEMTFMPAAGFDDGYNFNLNPPEPDEQDNYDRQDSLPTDVLNTTFTPEEQALIGTPEGTVSADATGCGICMNTKHTQGYSLFGGERMVLCASDDYPFTMYGGVSYTERDVLPLGFILDNGGHVVWDVELPTYTKAESVSVYNNRSRSRNVGLWYSKDGGGTWNPLTAESINEHQGRPKRWKIKAAQFTKDSEATFTHAALILVGAKLPKAQCPNLSQDIVMEEFAAPLTQSFTFPPTIYNIERESVFYDCKHGYLWKVTGVYQQKTTVGQIFGYQITARIIQPHEVFWQLRDNMLSTMDVAFRGLERFQGAETVEENARINGPMLDRVHSFTPYRVRYRGWGVLEENTEGVLPDTADGSADSSSIPSDQNQPFQIVPTAGNPVLASINSAVPGTVLGKGVVFQDRSHIIVNNGGGVLDRFGNLVAGEFRPYQYDTSPIEEGTPMK